MNNGLFLDIPCRASAWRKSGMLFIILLVFFIRGYPQVVNDSASHAQGQAVGKGLFESEEVLPLTLSGSIREILHDRTATPKYYPLIIEYLSEDNKKVAISLEAKTRGHFRRDPENCVYPPLLLHFSKSDALKSSIFKENHKLKLVMPCQGDQYIVHEWLTYKLYNLVTPKSFRARLVRITIADNKSKKQAQPFYGMLLEEEDQMARRAGAVAVNTRLRPEQTEKNAFLNMAVFEYLIGNTDWSIQFLQNIKLLRTDSMTPPVPVPYDFDMAGLVGSPYGKPAEELKMKSIRERRYRGYCLQDMKDFDNCISLYNHLKSRIYAVFSDCPFLDEKYRKATFQFLDQFYTTINDPVLLKKAFSYPCDKNGTGNVVIKGLRED